MVRIRVDDDRPGVAVRKVLPDHVRRHRPDGTARRTDTAAAAEAP